MNISNKEAIFSQYLRLVGVDSRHPSIEALDELVRSHIRMIPFENISKLYYKKRFGLHYIPPIQQYLDGIEKNHFGGTCYSNNYYMHLLLDYLGYHVMLCGADMKNPDVHIVNIVRLDGKEFLVDVGYAAPFLTPLPRDLSRDFEILSGYDRYVLKPQDWITWKTRGLRFVAKTSRRSQINLPKELFKGESYPQAFCFFTNE